MKFVIFSPMSTDSAIGRVTALLVAALVRRDHKVSVVRTEKASLLPSQPRICDAHIVSWTDGEAVAAVLRDADQVFYQIGDNHPFHCGALHWLPSVPGIVCLHDFCVANLFHAWARDHRAESDLVLAKWYGEAAVSDFYKADSSDEFIERTGKLYPMTEWICEMAHGVVSHSHWGMSRVARACAGPLRVLPLLYSAPGALPAGKTGGDQASSINILTVGHVNANKRIDSVIRVIASSELLRTGTVYRLCGPVEGATGLALAAMARSLGVSLVISGKIDDEALQMALRNADIVSCLRWPSLEAASASAIESMLYGKAVIVTDTGFYSELPDDCVRKISPENESAELRAALEFLSARADERCAMGQRARAWATRHCNAEDYAAQLVQLGQSAMKAAPRIRMADRLLEQLQQWGATPALLSASRLAEELALFHDADPSRCLAQLSQQ